MPFRYPVALELTGRRGVVVGGDASAEIRTRGLLDADARVVAIAPGFTAGLSDLARRGTVELVERPFQPGDLEGAFLVFVTGDDAEVTAAVFAEAEARGILCNSIDDIENCNFAVPSVLRRGELLVTVSTGGRSPAFAKRVRRRLEERFGSEYGVLLDLIGEVRAEMLPRYTVDFDTWARAWAEVLDAEDELIALVAAGRADEVRHRIQAVMAQAVCLAEP